MIFPSAPAYTRFPEGVFTKLFLITTPFSSVIYFTPSIFTILLTTVAPFASTMTVSPLSLVVICGVSVFVSVSVLFSSFLSSLGLVVVEPPPDAPPEDPPEDSPEDEGPIGVVGLVGVVGVVGVLGFALTTTFPFTTYERGICNPSIEYLIALDRQDQLSEILQTKTPAKKEPQK